MNRANHTRVGNGFTLIEVLLVITVVSVLCALTISVISKCKSASQGAACMSNLRQIGGAMNLYRIDHNDTYPKSWDPTSQMVWSQVLTGSGGGTAYIDPKILRCPALPGAKGTCYGMTSLLLWYPTIHRTDGDPNFFTQTLRKPVSWPLIMDADNVVIYGLDNPTATSPADSRFAVRHNGHADIIMTDGHAEQAQYGESRWSQSTLNDGTYY